MVRAVARRLHSSILSVQSAMRSVFSDISFSSTYCGLPPMPKLNDESYRAVDEPMATVTKGLTFV